MKPNRGILIGIGNSFRGDDAVGLKVIDALKSFFPNAEVSDGEPMQLVSQMENWQWAILVDAMVSGAKAGFIQRFEYPGEKFNFPSPRYSSHSVGIGEALRLGEALGKVPKKVIIYGIEGLNFKVGDDFSLEVKAQMQNLIERVKEECTKCHLLTT